MKKLFSSGLTALIITIFIGFFPYACVSAAEEDYSFNVSSRTLYVGWKSYLCDIKGTDENSVVSYRSEDETVATVSDEGEITPVSSGKTKVYADIKNGKKTYTKERKV